MSFARSLFCAGFQAAGLDAGAAEGVGAAPVADGLEIVAANGEGVTPAGAGANGDGFARAPPDGAKGEKAGTFAAAAWPKKLDGGGAEGWCVPPWLKGLVGAEGWPKVVVGLGNAETAKGEALGCTKPPAGALGCPNPPAAGALTAGALGCPNTPTGALGCPNTLGFPKAAPGALGCPKALDGALGRSKAPAGALGLPNAPPGALGCPKVEPWPEADG